MTMTNQAPTNAHTYRISNHAIGMVIRRGFADTPVQAMHVIQDALKNPSITYRSNLHPHQWKFHGRNSDMVVIVDPTTRIIPTVFISGHAK